jgi:hypothetical protein
MSNTAFVLIQLVAVFGGIFAFGIHQLWLVRRDQQAKRQDSADGV